MVIASGTVWWFWLLLIGGIALGVVRLSLRWGMGIDTSPILRTPRAFLFAVAALIAVGVVWLIVQAAS